MDPKAAALVFLTANPDKAAEYARILGRYGARPAFAAPEADLEVQAATLLAGGTKHVLREESYLEGHDGAPLNDLSIARAATNVSILTAWSSTGRATMTHRVPGYVDPPLAAWREEGERWFGWDDVFVGSSTGLSYRAAAALGLKSSARDVLLGRFISQELRYASLVTLNFSPLAPRQPVDFGLDPVAFVRSSLAGPALDAFAGGTLDRILGSVLSDGVFFRAAGSRRDRNFWAPGLNGGIPLVPKKDAVHELTFMVHDMMHWAAPDLVFDVDVEAPTRSTGRSVYILHRMAGEAISLVLADYLFVDALRRSGLDYDWSKRAIHPLFHSMDPEGEAHRNPTLLRELCRANTRFALLGDEAPFRALGADPAALAAYRAKYERFFVEDYRWTARNHEQMAGAESATRLFSAWTHAIRPLLEGTPTQTVSGFIEANGLFGLGSRKERLSDQVDRIFEATFLSQYAGRLSRGSGVAEVDAEAAKVRAMRRYLVGQSILCWRYGRVGGTREMGRVLLRGLGEARSAADMEALRSLHEAAIRNLAECGAITEEDAMVFQAAVPIFDPFFVFYDSKAAAEMTLLDVLGQVFGEAVPA